MDFIGLLLLSFGSHRADRSCPLAALIPAVAGQLLPDDAVVPARCCPSPRSRCLEQQQVFRSWKLKDNSFFLDLIFISDECLLLCCQAEGR